MVCLCIEVDWELDSLECSSYSGKLHIAAAAVSFKKIIVKIR